LPRLLVLLLRSKTISAPALTALLTAFTALFKFPLIPASSSTELELLEKTWTCIRDILPRCLPEVQRAMSEAWGGVLWRLKPEVKERAVVMLAQSVVDKNAGEVQDAIAWCVIYACKVRQPFLSYFLSAYIFSSPSRKLSIHVLCPLSPLSSTTTSVCHPHRLGI
jgi:hypothetical protein